MTKTIGIYKVTSNFNTEEAFKLVGASSQIEVCTRDYMSWCKKGKAPKTMQAEFDRIIKEGLATEPSAVFKVDILKACKDMAELDAAKPEFGLSNKGGKPKSDKPAASGKSKEKKVLTPEEALAAMGTLDGTPAPQPEPQPETIPETPADEAPVNETAKPNWEALFNEYKAGKAVKDICAELGISKSTFYNKTKSFK